MKISHIIFFPFLIVHWAILGTMFRNDESTLKNAYYTVLYCKKEGDESGVFEIEFTSDPMGWLKLNHATRNFRTYEEAEKKAQDIASKSKKTISRRKRIKVDNVFQAQAAQEVYEGVAE